jgi:hypothetical protein
MTFIGHRQASNQGMTDEPMYPRMAGFGLESVLLPSGLVETIKFAELGEPRPWRAEVVGLVLSVAIADGHPAKQHLFRWKLEVFTYSVVEPRPRLLRACVQAVSAREESQRVDIAS